MHSFGVARALHQPEQLRPGHTSAVLDGIAAKAEPADREPPPKRAQRQGRAGAKPAWLCEAEALPHLSVTYDADKHILWQSMAGDRPCFTPGLLASMTRLLDLVDRAWTRPAREAEPVPYLVLGSRWPGVFNLGGDLCLFLDLIAHGDRERLRRYAHTCARGQYRLASNLGHPLCTIALVQGDALGGGFEAALAHQVIIAERAARFGLPEVLFNLFPGMGAYSFLSRKLTTAKAEWLIVSGQVLSAEELHELGVVDVLAEDGQGVEAVHTYVAEYERRALTRRAVFKARTLVNPISREELLRVADLWVDSALQLSPVDVRKMRHLAKAQQRRSALSPTPSS